MFASKNHAELRKWSVCPGAWPGLAVCSNVGHLTHNNADRWLLWLWLRKDLSVSNVRWLQHRVQEAAKVCLMKEMKSHRMPNKTQQQSILWWRIWLIMAVTVLSTVLKTNAGKAGGKKVTTPSNSWGLVKRLESSRIWHLFSKWTDEYLMQCRTTSFQYILIKYFNL